MTVSRTARSSALCFRPACPPPRVMPPASETGGIDSWRLFSYPVGSSLPLELPTADWDQPIRRTLVGEPNTLRTLTPEEGEPASTIFPPPT